MGTNFYFMCTDKKLVRENFAVNEDKLKIYDEYGKAFSWDEYFDRVYSHSMQEREPVR